MFWFTLPSWGNPNKYSYNTFGSKACQYIANKWHGAENCGFWSVQTFWWTTISNLCYDYWWIIVSQNAHMLITLWKMHLWPSMLLCSGYMAPEYLQKRIITKKSDIFSLGVIVIEIITGRRDGPDSTGMSMPDFIENVSEFCPPALDVLWTRGVTFPPFAQYCSSSEYQFHRCLKSGGIAWKT